MQYLIDVYMQVRCMLFTLTCISRQGEPDPVRGHHHGGCPGDGQPRGCHRRRLQRTLRTQRLQTHDASQRAAG